MHRLAADDGTVMHVTVCCDLVVTLGPTRLRVAHDDACSALDQRHPDFLACRTAANVAVAHLLERRYGGPVLTVMADLR